MKPHATKQLTERRIEDLIRLRLDGAELADVRAFVRSEEREPGSAWSLADGASPLSDGHLRRLIAKADDAVVAARERSRRKSIRWAVAQRRRIYRRAVTAGDLRAALAALKDEAELLALYPPKRQQLEHAGPGGGAIPVHHDHDVSDEAALQWLDALERRAAANGAAPDHAETLGAPAPPANGAAPPVIPPAAALVPPPPARPRFNEW